MVYKKDEQFYTPSHCYNTRLSERFLQSKSKSQPSKKLPKSLNFRRSSQNRNEETYLVEEFENLSDRFSVASSNCFKDNSETFLETEDRRYCDQYLSNALVEYKKPMDFYEPPCAPDWKKYIKSGGIVLLVALIGFQVYRVKVQFDKLRADVDSLKEQIRDIMDARLDTAYQLSEVSSMFKDLKQSQTNFRHTIQKMVESEINKLYSDKTGRPDFALESAGGRIVQLSPGTENYDQPKSSLLGFSLCEGLHGPRAMIQTGTSAGECWAFKGSSGGVILKLVKAVKIDAVSLEHISKDISPSGDSATAPKDFTVWGLKTLTDRAILLGQFSYQMDGSLVQTFPLPHPIMESFEFVELKIMSNHGNPDFTCVYRFRVHGTMDK